MWFDIHAVKQEPDHHKRFRGEKNGKMRSLPEELAKEFCNKLDSIASNE